MAPGGPPPGGGGRSARTVLPPPAANASIYRRAGTRPAVTFRTRAIIAGHTYGLPVDMDPLLELTARHHPAIIEDAAEGHGQTYRGQPPTAKAAWSSRMVVTVSWPATACCGISVLSPNVRFAHEARGSSLRMTNLQAAFGLGQLERLGEPLIRKRRMGQRYAERVAVVRGLQLPLPATYADNLCWVYGVFLDEGAPSDAAEAMRRLAGCGIGTRPFFRPMHERPALRRRGLFDSGGCPDAEHLARREFYLPLGLELIHQQIDRVVSADREGVRWRPSAPMRRTMVCSTGTRTIRPRRGSCMICSKGTRPAHALSSISAAAPASMPSSSRRWAIGCTASTAARRCLSLPSVAELARKDSTETGSTSRWVTSERSGSGKPSTRWWHCSMS
jgi:DegT/DnrJ/EryC1/StrS aminotransferase family